MTQAQSDFAMTLNQLQEQVRELKAAQGWTEESLERRVVFLVSEVGEMAREILKLGDVSPDTDRESIKENLGMELYDIIWNLCDLANLVNIDLEVVFAKKQATNRTRQW